jgi:four helix bundle protein
VLRPEHVGAQNPKFEIRNPKQIQMTEGENSKQYDLEDRTHQFAKRVRALVKLLPRTESNREDVRQLVRASGSVAANYIEANEALSRKDFVMRTKISRKESKESRLFLRLIDIGTDPRPGRERDALVQEATELMNIFGSIIRKSE